MTALGPALDVLAAVDLGLLEAVVVLVVGSVVVVVGSYEYV
ncbi:hypothetical protein GCM10009660_10530 [Catellatospora bangladeshensis]